MTAKARKVLKNLKEVAEFEGYLEEDSTAFKELEAKLTPNLEKVSIVSRMR